ncbi:hypothetical protein BJ741DRAFT_691028 [Chytriomyces cf. hyalinus JEL632]|nr:hypothetical protein BJ741DRAFT_691028 [Chytriomyces cf. hyalinus JEL632]
MTITRQRKLIFATAAFLLIAAIISGLSSLAIIGRRKSERSQEYSVASGELVDPDVIVWLQPKSVDVLAGTIKYVAEFELSTAASSKTYDNDFYYSPAVALNVSIGSETFVFKANQPMLQQTGSAPLLGDFNFYPFDNFTGIITASAISGPRGQPVKLSLVVAGIPNGFKIVYTALDFTEEAIVLAEISRNPTVVTFATLIMIIMWFLALASVTFAGCLHMLEKKVEGAYLAFTIALLFAMPGVRNTMPSAPPIGCLADQMVLVWVMVILAFCVLQYFVRMILNLAPVAEKESL